MLRNFALEVTVLTATIVTAVGAMWDTPFGNYVVKEGLIGMMNLLVRQF